MGHRTRRATILAALGAVVVAGGAGVAPAADGEPALLGRANASTETTAFATRAAAALAGTAVAAPGVDGASTSFPGVRGRSVRGVGVVGVASAAGKAGVEGRNDRTSGIGLAGRAAAGTAVLGTSPSGTGVLARSTEGTALRVEGRASFSTAGLAIVPAGEYRVRVRPGVAVGAATIVLATVNCCAERVIGLLSRPISVWYVEHDPEGDAFSIVLTDRVTRDVRVGWFVIG